MPHQVDRRRRRADPDEPGALDEPGEGGVLGEEAVARVDRLRPRAQRRLDEPLADEVALGGRPGPDEKGLVGHPHVQRAPVGLRVDGDGADPQLPQRPEDPDGDLAAIRDQDFREAGHPRRILSQR